MQNAAKNRVFTFNFLWETGASFIKFSLITEKRSFDIFASYRVLVVSRCIISQKF